MNISPHHDSPTPAGQILATDLDGTLIPLSEDPRNTADLSLLAAQLTRHDVTLIYITGRHFALAAVAIEEHRLPQPDWLICDVGTSIFQRQRSGELAAVDAYRQHLGEIIAEMPIDDLMQHLSAIDGLRLSGTGKTRAIQTQLLRRCRAAGGIGRADQSNVVANRRPLFNHR